MMMFPKRTTRRACRAFTLIEVMACVLVLGMGLLAATALIFYGLRLARLAQAKSLGMATAMTVLADPKPLPTDPTESPDGATPGYLNGLWVERQEKDAVTIDADHEAVTIIVDVFESSRGTPCASVNRRIIRRK
jgi:prepilin-type N-terminal cleavage/methylation domain-containing protein